MRELIQKRNKFTEIVEEKKKNLIDWPVNKMLHDVTFDQCLNKKQDAQSPEQEQKKMNVLILGNLRNNTLFFN